MAAFQLILLKLIRRFPTMPFPAACRLLGSCAEPRGERQGAPGFLGTEEAEIQPSHPGRGVQGMCVAGHKHLQTSVVSEPQDSVAVASAPVNSRIRGSGLPGRGERRRRTLVKTAWGWMFPLPRRNSALKVSRKAMQLPTFLRGDRRPPCLPGQRTARWRQE